MVPLKRRRLGPGPTPSAAGAGDCANRFPRVVLYLLERRMGASRRAFLTQLGRSKGFRVDEQLSESVTHIISENNSGDEVAAWLDSKETCSHRCSVHLLDVNWYTDSMGAGHPVEIMDRHRLQVQQKEEPRSSVPSYACQRRTSLEDHNSLLTDSLSVLAENAELIGEEGRALAFMRAAAVLKALPRPVTAVAQLRGLPCLGEHSLRVVGEVLEKGASAEVEATRRCERYRALKALTGIFGVGAKTAARWFGDGIRNLQELKQSGQTLNRTQRAGLDYYDDLNQPVTKAEADVIGQVVQEAVESVSAGAQVTMTGGFRRGKQTGHDVDFLITHPEDGREEGLIEKVVAWLDSQGFLLYQKTSRNSYVESEGGPARPASTMDRFDRCFSIFRLDAETAQARAGTAVPAPRLHPDRAGTPVPRIDWVVGSDPCSPGGVLGDRRWRAVRVDLVVSPISQFPFALLGWTGSKLFERELRRWAARERSMSLSSHALYDNTEGRYLRPASEEEVFALLGLAYIPPAERNA